MFYFWSENWQFRWTTGICQWCPTWCSDCGIWHHWWAFPCFFALPTSKMAAKTTANSGFDSIFQLFPSCFVLESAFVAICLQALQHFSLEVPWLHCMSMLNPAVSLRSKNTWQENNLNWLMLSQNVQIMLNCLDDFWFRLGENAHHTLTND